MKRALLAQRLPHLLLGGLITGLLVASSVILPATPAHAADQYFFEFSLSEDLSFKDSYYIGDEKDLSENYETTDSEEICEKGKLESDKSYKESAKNYKEEWGMSQVQADGCRSIDSSFFIDASGKYDEKLLEKATSDYAVKINNKNEIRINLRAHFEDDTIQDFKRISEGKNIGFIRYSFPGKIKEVIPDIGKTSGNTWTLEKPLTEKQIDDLTDQLGEDDGWITFTTERHGSKFQLDKDGGQITSTTERRGSKLGLILGITIPAALIIAAVIVILIVRNKRKQKQQTLPAYQAGYGTYPPSSYIPGNSGQPTQSPIPGYPNTPGTPHKPNGQSPVPGNARLPMPGASPQAGYPPQYGNFPPAPYPPNAPQGQPVAIQGGNYPSPYPPTSPQNPAAWNSPMPSQGFGAPTQGFLPSQPPQPGEPGATEAS